MSATVILPSIDPENTRACLDTMKFVDPKAIPSQMGDHLGPSMFIANGLEWSEGKPDLRLVVVYNTTEVNLGVAGSWNIGVKHMVECGHDWLVILSAGVRFGDAGGRDFLRCLEFQCEPWPSSHGIGALEAADGLGFHLIAFHKSVFQRVGYFDQNFYPAYHEDNDFSYRIQLAYGIDSRAPDFVGPLWPKVGTDAYLDSIAHGILKGGVTVDFVALEERYYSKWGGHSGSETFTTPFDSGNPISWWPESERTGSVLGKSRSPWAR